MNYLSGLCEQIDDRRSYPQWKRYVTEHCVFGVDKDPIAVMLTKLSLWINSAMKDEPFATIDTHVQMRQLAGLRPGGRVPPGGL